MVFRRARRWSVTALVAGAVLIAGTLVSPAEALTQRSVSFRAAVSSALAGAQITVSGTISKAPKGTYVYLQTYNGDYWQLAALASTADSTGYYRTKLTLPKKSGTYAYRAYVPPSSTLSAATSGTVRLTALHKVYASLKASASTVPLGTSVKLVGKASSFVAGTKVTVERYNGLAWKLFTAKLLSSTGTFTHTFHPKATFSYRLKVPRTGIRAAATSASVRITVTGGEPDPTITTTTLPNAQTGTSYSQALAKTGGSGTWSLMSGALPSGVTLKSVGVISGTPKAVGTSSFKVAFTSSVGRATAKSLSLTVVKGPVITTTSLPAGSRGTAYSTTLQKTGAAGSWTLGAGALPAGITLDSATGAVAGTPTVDGTFPVTFRFTETASELATSKSFQLLIADPPDPVITTSTLPDGVVGAEYSKQLAKTGNAGTWTLTDGSLPAGLSLSSGGLISGTPTAGPVDPEFTVIFAEPNGTFDTATYRLHVSPEGAPSISPGTIPNGTQGVAYSAQLSASVSGAFNTWSIIGGSLPAGLSLGSGNGRITGTPTTPGTYTFTVRYQVFLGTSNTKVYTVQIAAGP